MFVKGGGAAEGRSPSLVCRGSGTLPPARKGSLCEPDAPKTPSRIFLAIYRAGVYNKGEKLNEANLSKGEDI